MFTEPQGIHVASINPTPCTMTGHPHGEHNHRHPIYGTQVPGVLDSQPCQCGVPWGSMMVRYKHEKCACVAAPLHSGRARRVQQRSVGKDTRAAGAAVARAGHHHGWVVQVEPIEPMLKPPGSKHLRLKCVKLLSSFAFKVNFRHYTMDNTALATVPEEVFTGRGLHSSAFLLNMSRS